MKIYLVCEETGGHEPDAVYSAWSTREGADHHASLLNVGIDTNVYRFVTRGIELDKNSNGGGVSVA